MIDKNYKRQIGCKNLKKAVFILLKLEYEITKDIFSLANQKRNFITSYKKLDRIRSSFVKSLFKFSTSELFQHNTDHRQLDESL